MLVSLGQHKKKWTENFLLHGCKLKLMDNTVRASYVVLLADKNIYTELVLGSNRLCVEEPDFSTITCNVLW